MCIYQTIRHYCDMNRLLVRVCAMSMVLLMLSSCIYDDESSYSSHRPEDGCAINLTISASSPATRTANDETENGSDDENFINIGAGDYAVFILDANGNFVERFEPGAVSLVQDETDSFKYHLSGVFYPQKELKEIKLLVLANWLTDFRGNYSTFQTRLESQQLDGIYSNKTDLNFTLPVESGLSWVPTDGTSGIPMFGLSGTMKLEKKPGDQYLTPVSPETVTMLRSLSKIEIVDKVPEGAKIDKCVLTYYNTSGRFIPDGKTNPNWYMPETQVLETSLPAGVSTSTNLQFAQTKKTITIGDSEEERDCFEVYIPEMNLPTDGTTRPEVLIYVEGVADPYHLELAAYDGKKIENSEYTALLRNHIYRFNINEIGISAELTLLIETPYWQPEDDEYTYVDAAAKFAEGNGFKWAWKDENYDPDETILGEQEQDRRTLLVSSAATELWAEATFTIIEPARGSWTLALYADDVTPKHWFRIELWDPEQNEWITEDQMPDVNNHISDTLSGQIPANSTDAKEVKIRIVASDLQYSSGPYSARLTMNVTTFDGRMVEVNLTAGDPMQTPSETDYYIIKQYPTPTEIIQGVRV